MHFLCSSSVCVLPRYFIRCARIKLLYIKEYIDISYKLSIYRPALALIKMPKANILLYSRF